MRASPQDYESLVEIADTCFPRDRERGGMEARWPHCFDRNRIRDSLIFRDRGKVVSHVRCVDQQVRIGEATTRDCGISGVSTLPEYRDRRLMSRLLRFSIRFMADEGYALSDLGGDRQRYGRFGWESAGRTWLYTITPRSAGEVDAPRGLTVAPFDPDSSDVDETFALQRQEPVGVERDRELHAMLLGRLGKEVWVCRRDGEVASYAVVECEKNCSIDELAGTAEGTHSIILRLLKDGHESVTLNLPWNHPLNYLMLELSRSWCVTYLRMLRILDLEKVLDDFSQQLEARYRRIGLSGGRCLSLAISDEDRQVDLHFTDAGMQVEENARRDGCLVFSRRDMVRLLFGPGAPDIASRLPEDQRFLASILPLDIFIWRNEMV